MHLVDMDYEITLTLFFCLYACRVYCQANVKLYLQLIDLEYSKATVDEHALSALFEKAIASPIAIEHRIAFSQRRLEFMEDFSSNVARWVCGFYALYYTAA